MKAELIKKRCDQLLLSLVGENLSERWWNSPNRAFENKPPIEVFKTSPDAVYTYLLRFVEGEG